MKILNNIYSIVVILIFSVLSCSNDSLKGNGIVKPRGVRGVWLTNVDSEVLNSHANIAEAVSLIDEIGLNTIFVVTWNKAMTTYPSKVMKEFTGIPIDPTFSGRDPLKELVEEAHKKNIKVIAWFEFGFSSSYKLNGGRILEKKPEWASKNKNGELVTKNGFDWMNGFNPEVQNFILSLILEVVTNYDVDGIQGDDRLPAMPSEAGYDDYTSDLFRKAYSSNNPPIDHLDSLWLDFRANLLNTYMAKIYDSVKAVNSSLIVSMAPSIYPWSKEEYLQDWPTWIRNKNVDILCPQAYRYNISDYSSTLAEMVAYADGYNFDCLAPGILIKLGEYYVSEDFLKSMINANRKHKIYGEVYFFYEGLKKHRDFLKDIYRERFDFPYTN